MSDFELMMYGLVATNAVIYAILVLGYVKRRIVRIPKTAQVSAAFEMLEEALTRSFPDLPAGFTWEEGIARAKNLKLPIEWTEVDGTLRKYEAYRYGTASSLTGDAREVLKLAYSLPRKPKHGIRSQR